MFSLKTNKNKKDKNSYNFFFVFFLKTAYIALEKVTKLLYRPTRTVYTGLVIVVKTTLKTRPTGGLLIKCNAFCMNTLDHRIPFETPTLCLLMIYFVVAAQYRADVSSGAQPSYTNTIYRHSPPTPSDCSPEPSTCRSLEKCMKEPIIQLICNLVRLSHLYVLLSFKSFVCAWSQE